MDKTGHWSLSPAYDLTFAYNPTGDWTATHQTQPEAVADDDPRVLAASVDDAEGPVMAVIPEVLGLFSRDPVPIRRSAEILHEPSPPDRREVGETSSVHSHLLPHVPGHVLVRGEPHASLRLHMVDQPLQRDDP